MFIYSVLKSKSSYGKMMGALSITLMVYILGYMMELNAGTLNDMFFWNQIQYLGIPFFPGLWLAVSMLYTSRGKYLKGLSGAMIFAIPVMTFMMRLTNENHHLYYSQIQLQQIGQTLMC